MSRNSPELGRRHPCRDREENRNAPPVWTYQTSDFAFRELEPTDTVKKSKLSGARQVECPSSR